MDSLPVELHRIIFSFSSYKDIKLLTQIKSSIRDIAIEYYNMKLPEMYKYFCDVIKKNIINKQYALKDCNIMYDNIDKSFVNENSIKIKNNKLEDGIYYHSYNTWMNKTSSLFITQYINKIFYSYNYHYVIMVNKNNIKVCLYTDNILHEEYFDSINLKPNSKIFTIY
jgi:hypothetical protein